MVKIHGFKFGKRVSRWIGWKIRTRTRPGYHRLGGGGPSPSKSLAITKLLKWGRKLTACATSLLTVRHHGSGYAQLGSNLDPKVPKGHLAVYVGEEDGELHRVLVPVIYFNHPLFGELLKEAEDEFGFHHHGGITIPCRVTEFERVKTRIAAGSGINTRLGLAWTR
ncbi:auxin-responsive protein SAUR36 [Lotus japonicus]|uniref:auxin-responsive protein SAUR36 n=1 Tax=Lotus japonicus TaxID=34305 RepID=UPI002590256B|nr:auxin-responsive protein SAUR36 [Lotus japonicus]